MHVIAGKAVCLKEALQPEYKEYQAQVVKNAAALASALMARGFNIVSGGTDNHLMLVDLQNLDRTGKEVEKLLDEVHITVNKNTVPNDPKSPFVTSGIRIGLTAVSQRGLKEPEIREIAAIINQVAEDPEDEANLKACKAKAEALIAKFPLYPAGSFDD